MHLTEVRVDTLSWRRKLTNGQNRNKNWLPIVLTINKENVELWERERNFTLKNSHIHEETPFKMMRKTTVFPKNTRRKRFL